MGEIDIDETIEMIEKRLAEGELVAYRFETRRWHGVPTSALHIVARATEAEMLERVQEDWGNSDGMSNERWADEVSPGMDETGEVFATTPWTIMSVAEKDRSKLGEGVFVPMSFVAACTVDAKLVYGIRNPDEIDEVD